MKGIKKNLIFKTLNNIITDKHYAYQLGVFVKLNHNEVDYTYFQDGRQVEEPTANLISGNTNE